VGISTFGKSELPEMVSKNQTKIESDFQTQNWCVELEPKYMIGIRN
jgi:hypothetical protein